MTAVMDRVCKEALELPLDQRLTLVYHILEQSDACSNPEEVEREWDGVIRERMERYDCGQAKTRPASDVFSAIVADVAHEHRKPDYWNHRQSNHQP